MRLPFADTDHRRAGPAQLLPPACSSRLPETLSSGISQHRIASSDCIKDYGAKPDDLLIERFAAILNQLQPVVKRPDYRSCAMLPSIDLFRSLSEVLDARTSGDKSPRIARSRASCELDSSERSGMGFNTTATAATALGRALYADKQSPARPDGRI
jgi:hypothetical protein